MFSVKSTIRGLFVGLAIFSVGSPAFAIDDDSTVVVTEVDDRLVDFVSLPVESYFPYFPEWDQSAYTTADALYVGVTVDGQIVWYEDAGTLAGPVLERFDLPGARRTSGRLILANDALWEMPWVGGRLEAPVPFQGWAELPASPLRDIAGDPLMFTVAGRDRVNAYDWSSHPDVDELFLENGDPVLLAKDGTAVLTGNGMFVEFLYPSGMVDYHQKVSWVVMLEGAQPGSAVGVAPQTCSGPIYNRVECSAVVVFPQEAVLFDPFGARVSTVFRPSSGRTLTSVDTGLCNVIFATEIGDDAGEGAILKVVPSWRDPGCFTDVFWGGFSRDIEWLGRQGFTRGCNPPANDRFCPDDFVTRGQMAAFLVRAFGYSDAGGGDVFVDDDDSIFEADVDRLGAAGVTRGCNPPANDRFCPDDFVTRGQMAAFLHRAFGG